MDSKIYHILDLKWLIIEQEGKLPNAVKTFFKCGIVLFRRSLYDRGIHDNNCQECEVEYRKVSDNQLLENYNKLYNLIILKYGT